MANTPLSALDEVVAELRHDGFIARASPTGVVHGGAKETGDGLYRRIVGPAFNMRQNGDEWTATLSPSKGQIPQYVTGPIAEVLARVREHLLTG